MRHAARQPADSFHFLRLSQLISQPFALLFISLQRASHTIESSGHFRHFVSAPNIHWIIKVAVFERANGVHQRRQRFCERVGNQKDQPSSRANRK